jgi:hypothetical protein
MTQPIVVDLPHRLGAEEAKRRIAGGIGRLKDHIPGGAAEVRSRWEGERMYLEVRAMAQEVTGHIDVKDDFVRLEFVLPPMLSLFAGKIAGLLRSRGADLLEDKSPKKGGG